MQFLRRPRRAGLLPADRFSPPAALQPPAAERREGRADECERLILGPRGARHIITSLL